MSKTTIEWTEYTWNPITGCSIKSPGCKNCYAMRLAGTRLKHHKSRCGLTTMTKTGPVWTGDVRFNIEWLDQPKRWRDPRKVFVVAHGDLFHEKAESCWINAILDTMSQAPQHEYQILTKRPEIAIPYLIERKPRANWLFGVSVEDQPRADERRTSAEAFAKWGWRTFVSYEPALGPVDWAGWEFLSWMISGGESGKGARPSHPAWHRSTRDWCAAHGIPYLFKQWGEWAPHAEIIDAGGALFHRFTDGAWMQRDGKKAAGRFLDGVEHNGFPEVRP